MVALDLNGDHKLDLATSNVNGSTVSVLLNQGTPNTAYGANTFAAPVGYNAGGSSPYHIVAADLNGDGKLDLAIAGYGSNQVGVLISNGDGTLQTAQSYAVSGNPLGITAGDFNGDGIMDLATANNTGNSATILLGNAGKPLPSDSVSGLNSGYGRGNLPNTSTVDYFSWTGTAGDTVYLASETPGNPSASGLYYEIDNAGGTALTSFYANYNNQGQSTPLTLPYTGTYFIHVGSDYSYAGEFRFRITEAAPTVQVVTKYGNLISNPNTLTLVNSAPGHLTGQAAGYISQADPGRRILQPGHRAGRHATEPHAAAAGAQHARGRAQHLQCRGRQRDQQHRRRQHRHLYRSRRPGRRLLCPGHVRQPNHGVLLDELERQQQRHSHQLCRL